MKHLLPLLLFSLLLPAQTDSVYKPTPDELTQIRSKLTQLGTALDAVRGKVPDDLFVDAAIYHKAGVWILRYPEEFYTAAYVKQALAVLDRGIARAQELQTKGSVPEWTTRTGRLARAYRSQVDDSVQPYGLIIPANYRADQPSRLDVVLHGRAATMNEVSFLYSHESEKPAPPEQNHLVLEVFGRTNNAYRWAGETDVYEALASVQQRYKIDSNRIVLRGFSMGGAGAWHIGLHDPSRWAAMEAGAGFTETKTYAKQSNLPPAVEATLKIYDSEDYAHNAWNVPTVGYGGEIDPQRRASVSIREALTQEGVRFTQEGLDYTTRDLAAIFLTGPQTGHKFHPDSKAVSDAFLDKAVASAPRNRDHLRFVTYTPRYGRDFWAQINALTVPYQRAELDAVRDATGKTITIKTSNIARLLLPDPAQGLALTIDGQAFQFQVHQHVMAADLVLEKRPGGKWSAHDEALLASVRDVTKQKRTGLQGPIDDAFMAPFLCVRPTGTAWNAAADQQARQRLERFTAEFAKFMRGDVRVKDDRDVTADDLARYHVIVFGDPGSNSLLAKMLPKLPLTWTRERFRMGGKQSSYAAGEYLPVLIYPNPLEPRRYVVVNSGHTFGARDFVGTNALLYPRLGDWAVLSLQEAKPAAAIGLFDSEWNPTAAP